MEGINRGSVKAHPLELMSKARAIILCDASGNVYIWGDLSPHFYAYKGPIIYENVCMWGDLSPPFLILCLQRPYKLCTCVYVSMVVELLLDAAFYMNYN